MWAALYYTSPKISSRRVAGHVFVYVHYAGDLWVLSSGTCREGVLAGLVVALRYCAGWGLAILVALRWGDLAVL